MRTTSIEWTEHTWNPIVGCSITSAGCRNCYAMRTAHRLAAMGMAQYAGTTVASKRGPVWTGHLAPAGRSALRFPLTLGKPATIFVNSMSDFFHEDMPDAWREPPYAIMRATPQHRYQILTKRPDVAARWVASLDHPLPANMWLGVSVENADVTDRLRILAEIPCRIRFVSFEPLLGPVPWPPLDGIHWAIIGGESGPHARPCEYAWVRELVDACKAAGVAVFFKQWGTWRNNPLARAMTTWPRLGALQVRMLEKIDPHGKGGALLDGTTYREFPDAA